FTDSEAPETLKRLNALADCSDGFDLAQADLRMRGPGEVYGTMQKGFPDLKIASLFDYDLMALAKNEVSKIFIHSEDLSLYPQLKIKIENLTKNIHLE
ncbi:MAG: hypothetical protein NT091_05135, partial [Candidatus Falkowbacteria bacterium]|nr:hypothetical protein [Candidatus Falkowbacteria bacterium]